MLQKANKRTGRYAHLPNFKDLLRLCDISQSELAQRVDVYPSTVSAWANGKREVPGAVMAYLELLAAIRRLPF
jgi:DNA-binding transcriptional regulator YiaG